MRPSLNVTAFSSFSNLVNSSPTFLYSFVNATSSFYPGTYTFTERYVHDPNTTLNNNVINVNITAIPPGVFRQRLALLVDTYWQSGFNSSAQTNGLQYDPMASPGSLKFTQATYYETQYVYLTSRPWLAVIFASSAMLLAVGAASVVFDAQTIGPDVLGFASSMTRNNKYINIPEDNSTMSGAERARMLGDVKVMM
ncbi:hypothetical protein MMC13_004039 [Lambiella insularis]|nr:hypothetical protein [Lambiella insularis]